LAHKRKKKIRKNKNYATLIFLLLIIFVCLDFIGWKTKNKSYIFFYLFKENKKIVWIFKKEEKPKVAIIIDDIGNNIKIVKEIISLKIPITISVLPHLRYSREAARIAHLNGLEVMLHLPLEPLNSTNHCIENGEITSTMTPSQIKRILENNIKSIPYIKGVNNHKGSKITKNPYLMKLILNYLKENNLFFIDSLTSNNSVAYRVAEELRLKSGIRNVFLDRAEINDKDKRYDFRYTIKMINKLLKLAKKKGKAIGIGHPFEETLKGLKRSISLIEKSNVNLVYASKIVD
jgi:hypothetical protein